MFERLIADCATVGIVVTISKTCVFLTGNTYQNRDMLKRNGWKWAPKKRAWYMPIVQYVGTSESVNPATDDYSIAGTAADGSAVIVAECHHETI